MENKHQIMLRMSKEGHSFPHWDTCRTCEDDFDEVCNWERDRLSGIIHSWLKENLIDVHEEHGNITYTDRNEGFDWTEEIQDLFVKINGRRSLSTDSRGEK